MSKNSKKFWFFVLKSVPQNDFYKKKMFRKFPKSKKRWYLATLSVERKTQKGGYWYVFYTKYYTDLSLTSKVLYGLLLDRLSLSIKNKWTDKDGDIYIIFARKEAQEKLNLSDKTVTKAFKELKNKKLIREIRTGFKKNNIIYVGKINHVKMYES